MLADQLNELWIARQQGNRIDALMRFSQEGLVLGAGTVLAKCRVSARDISIDVSDLRLRTLLTAAHLGRPTDVALAHLRKAADCWREGVHGLAEMHLVLSRLDRLARPEADAHRMFLADGMLKRGVEAEAIIEALESGPSALAQLQKYDPNQPRVPAGSGRTSGQWTTGGGGTAANSSNANSEGHFQSEGASSRRSSPQRERPPLSAEVNPSTVTPVGAIQGTYEGPEACQRATATCVSNIGLDEIMGFIGPNQKAFQTKECYRGKEICLQIEDEAWDRETFEFGVTLFSDKSVVFIFKGGRAVFYPREIAAIKLPRLRGLQRF